MVSFMSVAPTSSERIHEAKLFFEKLQKLIRQCGVMNLGLQINVSCPNVGHVLSELMLEVEHTLDLASDLGIPVLVKVNALLRPGEAIRLTDHPACDGLIVSNSIPWGGLGDKIPWRKLFGTDVSPLANIGGGGLSGAPLLRIVGEWITAAKRLGVKKPIVGGGGILSTDDASYMLDCGADAIEIGSVSILRPWRVQGIIRYVNTRLGYM
jgi:dihydroorotate dehydrogenase